MTADLPDTTGYPLEEARAILSEAGCEAIEVFRVGYNDDACEKRAMVIRQRPAGDDGVELTVASEWRTPIRPNSS